VTPSDPLSALTAAAVARRPLAAAAPADSFVHSSAAANRPHYANAKASLGIDFSVEKLAFPALQTLDPRIVRIAPGANNEHHRHAHESVFVVVSGRGRVRIGEHTRPVATGDVAFVPRWVFHQTINDSPSEPLVLVAVTDFGFTSALLGDYDQRTRLAARGADARPE
jgi:mannose-6-phosphate isomerase-like protein (cupin superfamily)